MLAGLTMPGDAYDQLSKLTTLEVLSLRNSKNVTDRAITPCKDMLMLRSLDLGHTDVTTISSLAGLSRLEELCLDHTNNLYNNINNSNSEAKVLDAVQVLNTLPSLRVLNISESPVLETNQSSLQLSLKSQGGMDGMVYIEPRSRRILFCEAIMNNDSAAVRRMAGDGIDINMTLGPWFADTLRKYWLKRYV